MTRGRRQPQRTCLGCREVHDQQELLRFVRSPEGEVLVDLRGRLPGRGAYLCWSRACLEQALQRKQFDRAFKQDCRTRPLAELVAEVKEGLIRHILNLIGMGRRSAQVMSGSNAVLTGLNDPERFAMIILATDISAGIAEKVRKKAGHLGVVCLDMFTKDELGRIAGRAEHSVLGIQVGQLADAIEGDLRRYRNISGES